MVAVLPRRWLPRQSTATLVRWITFVWRLRTRCGTCRKWSGGGGSDRSREAIVTLGSGTLRHGGGPPTPLVASPVNRNLSSLDYIRVEVAHTLRDLPEMVRGRRVRPIQGGYRNAGQRDAPTWWRSSHAVGCLASQPQP